ncbi:MAG: D-alanyl-D-alanine carboxypeptidase family protein, partial [Beijerinckiaceae bacterium]
APVNSKVAVHDLLQGLIVMAGNDAALALAEGLKGGEAAFVVEMQAKLAALGLMRSTVRNATGYADPAQKITAREWTRLAIHLNETHPERYGYFSQREFTWNQIRQLNRNPLLASVAGVDGLMTGNVADAGHGLAVSAQQDERRLILVLLGAETAQIRALEARRLLEWGFRNFTRRKLLDARTPLGEIPISGGVRASIPVGLADSIETLLPIAKEDKVEVRILHRSPLPAPVAPGAEVGRLVVTRGTVIAVEVPVIALEGVEQGSLFKRATDNLWEALVAAFRGKPAAVERNR